MKQCIDTSNMSQPNPPEPKSDDDPDTGASDDADLLDNLLTLVSKVEVADNKTEEA